MNHPTPEEWMEFVYDESPASGELGRHLKTCPVCQAHVAEWRKGMATLNAWPLAVRPARWRLPAGAARWAAAALIFLAFGYGFGRLSSPAADQKALVVALRQPLQQSLLDLTVTVIPGAGFAKKAASLSLPPFQPGTPLTFKLVGPIMTAKVAF